MNENEHCKIGFRLPRQQDGFPPVDWEGLLSIPLGEGKYRIDNVPFYTDLISLGDVVAASNVEGRLVFERLLSAGGHSTIRVVVFDAATVPRFRSELVSLGCSTELSNIPTLFAVDVPAEVDYAAVVALLDGYFTAGVLDYEESSIRHDLPVKAI